MFGLSDAGRSLLVGILATLFFIVREISHLILDDTPTAAAASGPKRKTSWRNREAFAALVFIVSLALAVHAVHLGLRSGTQEAISLSLSVFFLVCSAAWVAERELDVSTQAIRQVLVVYRSSTVPCGLEFLFERLLVIPGR